MAKKYEIRHAHFSYSFGRNVCQANLVDEDENTVLQGPLSYLLSYARDNDLVIANSQDMLNFIILDNGYAS